MVVHAPTTRMLALLRIRKASHIAPVVVAKEHDDIVGHAHTRIIVVEHFLIERPHLRSLVGRFTRHLRDNLTLVFNHLFEQFRICVLTHRLVAITTHTNGDNILSVLGTLHTLTEETVECFLIGGIIPSTVFTTMTRPFLMVASHWFVMRCADNHAHILCRLGIERVVGIESPTPHGRPMEIASQAKNEFKHASIETMVTIFSAISILHP